MQSLPGGEGVRFARSLSAWTLATSVPDELALREVPADAVVCGADAVTPDGLVNKVKTAALAEAARDKGVPVYAVAGDTKLLNREPPLTGPFETVPLELFTAVATPDGLLSPAEAAGRARDARLAPELLPLFQALRAHP
jgi:translation initiation factor 2B subunit (eIF-2B alpha/beta/delta family)